MEVVSNGIYERCGVCGQMVRLNKRLFGSLHICLTDCEEAERHLDIQTRNVWSLKGRRTEKFCARCGETLPAEQ